MNFDQWYFLLPAFVMCLILVGIHCYLGLHVLARNVLFIDLALAQVAALGTTVAFAFGYEHHDRSSFFIALGFTFFAAFLFTLAGRLKDKLSVEAFIGIVYAFASAFVVLIIDKSSHGAEHLKYTLVGQILWTDWQEVLHVALIYSGVSVIHYIFRKPIIKNSFQGGQHWFWDFLFYSLFGVVITCSVSVSGVLLVFAFLIVPAVMSSMFANRLLPRLIWGWIVGFILCGVGLGLSVRMDLPPGAALVVVFTTVPVLYVFIAGLKRFARS